MELSLFNSSQVNSFLVHLYQAIETRDGRDVVLLFAGEAMRTLTLVMDLLISYLRRTGTRRPMSFSKTSLTERHIRSIVTWASQTTLRMKALTNMVDEWQVMNRLWGVLDMWMATRDLVNRITATKSTDKLFEALDIIIRVSQTAILTSFHVCEAIAFLSSKSIIKSSAKTQEQLSLLAIRFWAVSTVTEIDRLLLDWGRTAQNKGEQVSDDSKARWKENMLQNLAWAFVAVHGGLRDGLIPETLVSPFAVFATWSLMKNAWKSSA